MKIVLVAFFVLISTLFPLTAQIGFTQTGKASYYADRFHGRKTHYGEKYDMNAYTAAHRELPQGTKIKVTNTKNNKSVIVRVNDLGPFSHGRILDISKAAARDIEMLSQGVATVTLEVVELSPDAKKTESPETKTIKNDTPTSTIKSTKPPSVDVTSSNVITSIVKNKENPSAVPSPEVKTLPNNEAWVGSEQETASQENTNTVPEKESPTVEIKDAVSDNFKPGSIYNPKGLKQSVKGFGLQVGLFSTALNAIRYCRALSDSGFSKLYIKSDLEEKGTVYRVFVGDYEKEEDAQEDMNKLKEKNKEYFFRKY